MTTTLSSVLDSQQLLAPPSPALSTSSLSTLPTLETCESVVAPPSPALSGMATPIICSSRDLQALDTPSTPPRSPDYMLSPPLSFLESPLTFSLTTAPSSPISLTPLPRDVSEIIAQHEASLKAPPKKRAQKGSVPRAQQNRLSAQKVRDRLRAKEQFLESTATAIESENSILEAELQRARLNQLSLLAELEMLKRNVSDYAVQLLQQPAPLQQQPVVQQQQPLQQLLLPIEPLPLDIDIDDANLGELLVADIQDSAITSTVTSSLVSSLPSSPAVSIDTTTDDTLSSMDMYSDAASSSSSSSPDSSIIHSLGSSTMSSLSSSPQSSSTLVSLGSEDSCESAALAGVRPQQQDILNFVIVLQLLMRTTLSWATAMKLMVAIASTSKDSLPASNRPLVASCRDAFTKTMKRTIHASSTSGIAWPPRLAGC